MGKNLLQMCWTPKRLSAWARTLRSISTRGCPPVLVHQATTMLVPVPASDDSWHAALRDSTISMMLFSMMASSSVGIMVQCWTAASYVPEIYSLKSGELIEESGTLFRDPLGLQRFRQIEEELNLISRRFTKSRSRDLNDFLSDMVKISTPSVSTQSRSRVSYFINKFMFLNKQNIVSNDSQLDIITPEVFYSTPKPARPPKMAQATKKKTPPQQHSLTAETPSTQPRLRKPKRNVWEKADAALEIITKDFDSLGHFLSPNIHEHYFLHGPPVLTTAAQGIAIDMVNFEILWHNINPEGYWELASVAPLTSNILSLMAEQEQDEMPELEPAGMLAGEIEGGNGRDMKLKL
ncbi:hypothetical protein B0H10DRAFT_1962554 [Mycena sp. CBHHK59/15]|nr:hypothetical protein B0H10DRAFT_1962554 [Mycena sp. CBHHK59/15]